MQEDSDNSEMILNTIKTHLHDTQGQEVLLLLIAQQNGKTAAKAIRFILNNQSEYEQWLHRDLLFAGSCLAENPKGLNVADSRLVQEILERLVSLEISDKTSDKLKEQVFKVFCSLCETDFAPQCLELLKAQASEIDSDRLIIYRAKLGEKERVIDELIQELSDIDYRVRESAAEELGNLGNDSETVIETLLNTLSDIDDEVCWSAAEALVKLGKGLETVIKALLTLLNPLSDSYYGREIAAWVLGNLGKGSETVIKALLNALSDSTDGVRNGAPMALGNLGNASETVIEALINALSDSNDGVRSGAATALGNLGNASETVIEALLNALSDSNNVVRWNAARALGNLGHASKTLIEALLTAWPDRKYLARWNAAEALGNLGKQSDQVKPLVVEWIQQHEESKFVGSGIDALWHLVNGS